MKTQLLINLVGYTEEEVNERLELASIELGLSSDKLAGLTYFAKVFVQRRIITGCEALAMVGIPNDAHFKMVPHMMPAVHASLMIFTPNNRSTISSSVQTFFQSFDNYDDTIITFEQKVKELKEEAREKEAPVQPILNKSNYDVIQAHSTPAQQVNEATLKLGSMLFQARQEALSYAPTDALDGILADIQKLTDANLALRWRSERILDWCYKIIKDL